MGGFALKLRRTTTRVYLGLGLLFCYRIGKVEIVFDHCTDERGEERGEQLN